MPLTPAEVHNVAFKKPPIGKRGYDEDEVDAFLDIVEVELSRLLEENNDLRTRGGAPDPVPADGGGADNVELVALRDETARTRQDNERLQARVVELENEQGQGAAATQQQLAELQQELADSRMQLAESQQLAEQLQQAADEAAAAATVPAPPRQDAPAPTDHHQQAVQILALAQQTADQHVAQVKAEADKMRSDAEANAASTVGDAQTRADELDRDSTARATRTINDAEQRATTITAHLEQRKASLERRVEELRSFEREYRTRLRSYLESQVRDLDASGRAEPDAPSTSDNNFADAQQG